MPKLPSGTITFVFTDIEGSTKLWEQHPEQMRTALAHHDTLLRQVIQSNNGVVFKTIGDAFCAAFATAPDALAAALAAQRALLTQPRENSLPLRVRMALHTGNAELRDNDYFGQPLNRIARLLAIGHGGQVLVSAATQELTRDTLPPSVSLKPLGEHRLRDLGRPETVFQLLHPTLPDTFRPLRSLENPELPNNLPQQVTSFIGREKEIARTKTLLEKTRLLTLTGSGGCGKTRLALQVAADGLEEYPDGVWLVELAPLADPDLVPQTVAQALGVTEEPGKPLTQTLTAALKPKRLLLVLDNCEHLLDASAQLADALLRSCPHVTILASSREGLGIGGELTYRVPSLSLPDFKSPMILESIGQYEAVALFVERARFHQPAFKISEANAAALASVCHRLDGIPLAIELAAARIRSMTMEELGKRLDDRFRILTGGSRTALPRQQTLRALIDWSYALLDDNQKRLLCRLCVFAGGWTLEEAEAVCSGDGVEAWEMLDLLTSLADKSLVIAEAQGEITRYRLLETVRQYARDKLAESEEAESVRERHRDYFLSLAEEVRPKLMGPEQAHWLNVVEVEYDNLRAALTFCLEAEEGGEKGLRLGGALKQFWLVRGHLSEGREHLAALLSHPDAQGRSKARADALNGAGVLAWYQGDYAASRALQEESLAISRELGDRRSIADCLSSLGMLVVAQGDLASARSLYEESLGIMRELRDQRGIAGALNNLGLVAQEQGDYTSARALHEESLAISREADNRWGIGHSLNNLGNVARHQGDYASASALYQETLAIRRELGDRAGIANCLNNLAITALEQGDYAASRALQEESLGIMRELGHRREIAGSLHNLGLVAQEQGDYASARSLYEEALGMNRELGNRAWEANNLANLGLVAQEQGDYASACELLKESLGIQQELGNRAGMAHSLEAFASLAAMQGQAECTLRLWAAAQRLREEMGAPLPSNEREEYDRQVSAARQVLGEEAFEAAWAEGRAMTMEQAIEYALSGPEGKEAVVTPT